MYRTLLAGLVGLGLAAGAQAAVINWSTPSGISGDADVNTSGSLLYAYNFNQGSTAQTVNGVTFAGYDSGFVGGPSFTSNGNVSLASADFMLCFNVFGSGNAPFTGLSSAYQGLLSTAIFTGNDAPSATLTLQNLTVGNPYLVQIWTNDSRFGGRSQTYAAGNTSAAASSNLLDADGGVGTYIIGTFVADGTSQAINISPNVSTQINALQVRTVPEPASVTLLLGGLGLLARRRARTTA